MTINKREIMKQVISIKEEISQIEKDFSPKEEYSISGGDCVILDNLHSLNSDLYSLIFPEDSVDYPIIDFIMDIIEGTKKGKMSYFDTDLLSKEERKKASCNVKSGKIDLNENGFEFEGEPKELENESILLTPELYKNNEHCFIYFKTIDEILDFVQKKDYFIFN